MPANVPGPAMDSNRNDAQVCVLADMLFASRVRAAGRAAGVEIISTADPARLRSAVAARPPRLIIIDLELRGHDVPALIRELRSSPATADTHILGFASHTNTRAIETARDAGAHRVLARSAFVRQLPGLIRE